MSRQEFFLEYREGPQLNCIQGRCWEACKACWEKGAQLEIFSCFSDIGPASGWGWGKPIKENPKTSLSAFTNYKGKLILAASVGANSGLSYLEFNSTWKEILRFFFFLMEIKVTEMNCPLYGKNSWVETYLRISHGQAQIRLGFFHTCSPGESNMLSPVIMNNESHQVWSLAQHSWPHPTWSQPILVGVCPTMLSFPPPTNLPFLTSFNSL